MRFYKLYTKPSGQAQDAVQSQGHHKSTHVVTASQKDFLEQDDKTSHCIAHIISMAFNSTGNRRNVSFASSGNQATYYAFCTSQRLQLVWVHLSNRQDLALLDTVTTREANNQEDDKYQNQNHQYNQNFHLHILPPHFAAQLSSSLVKLVRLHALLIHLT